MTVILTLAADRGSGLAFVRFHEAELITFARDVLEVNGIDPEWTRPVANGEKPSATANPPP